MIMLVCIDCDNSTDLLFDVDPNDWPEAFCGGLGLSAGWRTWESSPEPGAPEPNRFNTSHKGCFGGRFDIRRKSLATPFFFG